MRIAMRRICASSRRSISSPPPSPAPAKRPPSIWKKEDFAGAMRALSKLRAPVDAFFDDVTVNAENADLRLNRLRLLAELRRVMTGVADFGKIAGESSTA